MKRLLVIVIALLPMVVSGQEKFFIGAGATSGFIKGTETKLQNTAGYYLSLGINDNVVNKYFAIDGEISYQNINIKTRTAQYNSQSINTGLYYKFHPFKFPLNFLAGVQMGVLTSSKIETNDSTERLRGVRFAGLAGVSYKFGRLEAVAKYNHLLDGTDPFDSFYQCGVNYSF